jgi:hypothetical protein
MRIIPQNKKTLQVFQAMMMPKKKRLFSPVGSNRLNDTSRLKPTVFYTKAYQTGKGNVFIK